ncbi:MAG: M48 family metallopeptidase [Bdellovibrionales bacterium]|jgi:Zn-dependent protease with chaperone function|nr:M48 family metallopeptidase [Bdellovibrionales bacterium]
MAFVFARPARMLMSACALLSLAACAGPVTAPPQSNRAEIQQETLKQQSLVFERHVTDSGRIFNLAYPILVANAEFCRPKTAPSVGATVWNVGSLKGASQTIARQAYNLGPRLTLRDVVRNGPAARAGLRSGDILIAINGQNLPANAQASTIAENLVKQSGLRPVEVVFERGGRAMSTVMQPVEGCNYPVILDSNSNDINAYADGQKIVISRGIVRFSENDNELALVIAHELGHNAMRHIDKMRQNATVGSIGGLAIDSLLAAAGVSTGGVATQMGGQMAIQQHSVAFEQEADYVGMYFMERAGFSAASVANFWRRMGAENARAINTRTSHPTSVERFLAIERTYAEIQSKKRNGQALVPNMQQRR